MPRDEHTSDSVKGEDILGHGGGTHWSWMESVFLSFCQGKRRPMVAIVAARDTTGRMPVGRDGRESEGSGPGCDSVAV